MVQRSVMLLLWILAYPVFAQVSPPPGAVVHDIPPPAYADDRVLVQFVPGTAASDIGKANQSIGGKSLKVIPGIDVHVIGVPAGTALEKVNLYNANPNVVYAEPDFNRVLTIPDEGQDPPPGGIDYFSEQWGLHNTGQFLVDPSTGTQTLYGSFDADIDAPEGWDISTGNSAVSIALYPEHGASVAELLNHADYAMYVVKKRGRDACLIYRDEMLDEAGPGAITGKPG